MLVSIVVPTYRMGQLAVDAVRSALAQTHEELEVIVVVDTSPVDTLARTGIRRPARHGRPGRGQPRTGREPEPWSGDDDRATGGAAVPA
jgi:GT2 family glycosyltransferase